MELTKRSRAFARTVKIIVAMLSIVILLVAAGTAYTWYVGRQKVVVTPPPAPTLTAKSSIRKTPKVDPNAAVGVAIQTVTDKARPGDNAQVTIRTTPEAECLVKVEYNKVASKDSGLVMHTADEYGVATWSWTVDSSAPLGSWPITITCTHHNKSGVVATNIQVVKSLE